MICRKTYQYVSSFWLNLVTWISVWKQNLMFSKEMWYDFEIDSLISSTKEAKYMGNHKFRHGFSNRSNK